MKDGTDEGLPSVVDISGLFQIRGSAGTDENKTNTVFWFIIFLFCIYFQPFDPEWPDLKPQKQTQDFEKVFFKFINNYSMILLFEQIIGVWGLFGLKLPGVKTILWNQETGSRADAKIFETFIRYIVVSDMLPSVFECGIPDSQSTGSGTQKTHPRNSSEITSWKISGCLCHSAFSFE